MLLCVCANPALDVTYRLEGPVRPGESHRVAEVSERAGGKGLNVAGVLGQLGVPATVLGLAGGPDGRELRRRLRVAGLNAVLVHVTQPTRRTLTVVDPDRATAFNEPGPEVTDREWTGFQACFDELLDRCDGVVLSGSLPPGLPAGAYATLTRLARERRRPVLLDADGPAFRSALPAGPTLVKPNLAELRAFTGENGPPVGSPEGRAWVAAAGRRLVAEGARGVVVSLGPAGLVAITGEGEFRASGPVIRAGNPTGAGDALVAVLAHGLVTGRPWPELLRDAVATSAAAVARPVAGEIDLGVRARLAPSVAVRPLAPLGPSRTPSPIIDTGRKE